MDIREDEFFMPYLHSERISKQSAQLHQKKLPMRKQPIDTSNCSACPKVLGKWKKADLVKALIEAFPIARAAMISRRTWTYPLASEGY